MALIPPGIFPDSLIGKGLYGRKVVLSTTTNHGVMVGAGNDKELLHAGPTKSLQSFCLGNGNNLVGGAMKDERGQFYFGNFRQIAKAILFGELTLLWRQAQTIEKGQGVGKPAFNDESFDFVWLMVT